MSTPPKLAPRWKPAPASPISGYPRLHVWNGMLTFFGIVTLLFTAQYLCNFTINLTLPLFQSHPADDLPPTYTSLREWESRLPQHNLNLPFPEGRQGRYVLFTNSRINRIGWNNKLNEMLLNTWLAYESNRGYVFHDFAWQDHHYPWPLEHLKGFSPRTPLNALLSGPSAGGSWEEGDPTPRAISDKWFDIICPQHERRIINTRDVKPSIYWEDGRVIFSQWKRVLSEAPERCIEVVPAAYAEDTFPETFDILFWSGPRGLSLWNDFINSPVSRLLRTSPVVQAAIENNQHLFIPQYRRPTLPFVSTEDPFKRVLAMHIRRGDFKEACLEHASLNSTFYSWNLLPFLSDSFTPPSAGSSSEIESIYLERCLPTAEYITQKVKKARSDYLAAMTRQKTSPVTLDVLYIMSNDNTPWLNDLKSTLMADGWNTVVTSRDLRLDSEQKEVGVAVDMDLGRLAAVFIGNGWSSFTSNVVHRRLVEGKLPISIRFW